MTSEQTYIMVKPDGVQRGLVGEIMKRFEQKGYKLIGLKLFSPTKDLLEKHYADLSKKAFFPGLIEYMASGPVCCMVWEGMNAVLEGRKMLGATKPADSALGTIRGDFCIDVGRNLCHGSDAVESAQHEIGLWFPEGLQAWDDHSATWIYEDPPAPSAGGGGAGGTASKAYHGKPIPEDKMTFSDEAVLGQKLPELNLLDWLQDGAKEEATSAVAKGKNIVVVFWGKYAKGDYKFCCHASDLNNRYPDVQFIGVSCDAERADAEKLLKKNGTAMAEQAIDSFEINFPSAYDKDKKFNKSIQTIGMWGSVGPGMSLIVNSMGTVVWKEQFSAAWFMPQGQFEEQLRRLGECEKLMDNGKRPVDPNAEEEIECEVGGAEFDAFADGDGGDY